MTAAVPVEVATRLYALPPEEFTAARSAEARADKPNAPAIKALRKPTVGAWLINTLVRTSSELVDELLALGPLLAQAQAAGAGDTLRELGEQRRRLVDAVTARAVAVADRSVPAAARAEVASTLEAALADPESADAVRTGRLVRSLSYAGFGEVDLGGAVAAPAVAASPGHAGRREGRQVESRQVESRQVEARQVKARQVEAAQELSQAAAGRLDDAVRAAQEADRGHERAAAAAVDAEQAVLEAQSRRDDAVAAEQAAATRAEEAVRAVAAAQDAAEQARAALDALRRA